MADIPPTAQDAATRPDNGPNAQATTPTTVFETGDMAQRTSAFDWSRTPVGPAADWPQSLKTAVRIMLGSRYAMWLGWGPDLTFFYNDAYADMTLGPRHPWALGRPTREVWSEIWEDIGPRADSVLRTGKATWDEGLLLFLERQGFPEETYHTFSYSPIPGDGGDIGGMLCVVTEDTERTIGERRLRTLRELAARTTDEARSAEDACQTAARTLATSRRDVPFALIYLLTQEMTARLAGAMGLPPDSNAAPARIDLATFVETKSSWPLASALKTGQAELVSNVESLFGPLHCEPWPEPTRQAVVLPFMKPGQARPTGFIVAGVSPRLVFDDGYRGFFDLLAGHVATAVANARAYEDERRRAESLAELDRAKTAFFSNVSHEFRTPLTLMLGPIEDLLNSAERMPGLKDQLESIHRNGLRLLRLVNSLLDFSRIEAGRSRALYQPTDLAALTAELASMFRAAIEKAGLKLRIDCGKLLEPVHVDREMWEKVVLNLLSNAFKFTLHGEIAVSLRQVDHAAKLCVQDSGIGIPPEEMPRLFERFHRVKNSQGRTHEGSGIGLALVQELVKLHGGSIAAESILGKGTIFIITIPLGTAHLPADQIGSGSSTSNVKGVNAFVEEALRWLPDAASKASETGPSGDKAALTFSLDGVQGGGRPYVLVADDNADMRKYVERLLGDQCEVETAPDGEAALASIRRRLPDLVLTDVMMPRLDGFGLLHELRRDSRTRSLPIIMVSARAGEESRVEGMEAGADDYLVKPFSARELQARVSAHLQMARMRREAYESLRRSEERLRSAATENARLVENLREEGRRKNEFLATLAHELRNPLAPLRNGLLLLKLAKNDEAANEHSRSMMERQLGQMVRLIDDLLDLSRISQGKIELRKDRIDLLKAVRQAIETSNPLIESGGHSLTTTLPDDQILVHGDMARLTQVISNLLNNAAKYTEPGGQISLKVQRTGDETVVTIRDTGIGIPPTMLPRVFDLFTQIDRTLERSQGGLGIGLSLVKQLTEMHGGSVSAHSEGLGRGSEFTIRLPALSAPSADELPKDAGAGENSAAGCRILVVDDNRDSAESLAMVLDALGHQTRTGHDGLEALEIAKSFLPELVLLDIGMPRLNGYETARQMRKEPWGQKAMLVALSGWGQQEDRRRSLEAGFDRHMVKPVDPEELVKLIASLKGIQS